MKEKIIVNQEKFPILSLFAALWVVFMGLFDPIFDSILLASLCFSILFILVHFSLFSIQISINDQYIKRSNKQPFRKKRSNELFIKRDEFQGLVIRQNEKKYFEICAADVNGNLIVLAMLPNKIPALEKKSEFEVLINTYWQLNSVK